MNKDPHRAYQPQGNIQKVFYSQDPEILVEGPVRTGKTRGILEKCYICAEKYPGCRILWVRKTKESIAESALQTFEDHVLPEGHYLLDGGSRSHKPKYVLRNGSEIVIGGMDKPSKILSSEYDIICAFEATELDENDWEHLATRNNNGVIPYNQCIADCNPAHPEHWLNIKALQQSIKRIPTTLKDNPKFYNEAAKDWTKAGHELLRRLQHLTGARKERLLRGLWVAYEGMVFDTWDQGVFVTDDNDFIPDTVVAGVDIGYHSPSSVVVIGANAYGQVRVLDEFYATKTLIRQLIDECKALQDRYDIDAFLVDPSSAEPIEEMRLGDLPAIGANNSVKPGIDTIASYLRIADDDKLCLTVSPKCINLIREFSSYRWKDKSAKEEPIKEADHALDALRYGMMYLHRTLEASAVVLHLNEEEFKKENRDPSGLAIEAGELVYDDSDTDDVEPVEVDEMERAGVWN